MSNPISKKWDKLHVTDPAGKQFETDLTDHFA